MKWWIVEDALRDKSGHWFEYLRTFRRGLETAGDQVRILASRECSSEVLLVLRAEPVLPRSIWARMSNNEAAWRRILRLPEHALATFMALRNLFRKTELGSAPDILFVPTVWVHHLLGWWMLFKAGLVPKKSRVLLLFLAAPIRLSDDGRATLSPDTTGWLFRLLIRGLAVEVSSERLVFGAETEAMRRALQEVTGFKFVYLPQPVEVLAVKRVVLPARPITFGCYGAARWEKGSDIYQEAIRKVLEEDPTISAKFVIQWLEDFSDNNGKRVRLNPWLKHHPKVEVINRLFRKGEYEKRLAETDVMVLPYRSPYRLRGSRVVLEAMTAGIPVIATEQSTLLEQALEHGCGLACKEESLESLVGAIMKTLLNIHKMQQAAQDKIPQAKRSFSVAFFRELLQRHIAEQRS